MRVGGGIGAYVITPCKISLQLKNKKKKKLVLSKSFPSQALPGVQDLELIDFLLHDAL